MFELLNQLNDEKLDFTVKITDTDGVTDKYEFLDIVSFEAGEYAVLSPLSSDGDVEIFRILSEDGKEIYSRITNPEILESVFEIFRVKNEDEFDFD